MHERSLEELTALLDEYELVLTNPARHEFVVTQHEGGHHHWEFVQRAEVEAFYEGLEFATSGTHDDEADHDE